MIFRDARIDRRAVLDQVLPEHKKITEAPASIVKMPGYSRDSTSEELNRFEATVIAEECQRRYKAVDANGNVYLVMNPCVRRIETRKDGTCWVVHPKPQLVMTYAEAKRTASQLTVQASSANVGSLVPNRREKKKSQTDFDY